MNLVNLLLFLISVLFSIIFKSGFCFGTYWNKFTAVNDGVCVTQNIKLLSLLNLLCNTTQTTSNQMRDACYGCFFRAGSITNGPSQLNSLNACAKLYINGSNYASCTQKLQAAVDGKLPTPLPAAEFCYAGHCDFVRCIRRINAQQLIATCYQQSIGTRLLEDDQDRIEFYTNITACILAKTRCSQYNPISGELQNQYYPKQVAINTATATVGGKSANLAWFGSAQPLYYNSMQVSTNGDLRIFTFPTSTAAVSDFFCSKDPTLRQAGFGNSNC